MRPAAMRARAMPPSLTSSSTCCRHAVCLHSHTLRSHACDQIFQTAAVLEVATSHVINHGSCQPLICRLCMHLSASCALLSSPRHSRHVRAPVARSFIDVQVFSRVMLVWGVVWAAPEVKVRPKTLFLPHHALHARTAPVDWLHHDGLRLVHHRGHPILVLRLLAAWRRPAVPDVVPVRSSYSFPVRMGIHVVARYTFFIALYPIGVTVRSAYLCSHVT